MGVQLQRPKTQLYTSFMEAVTEAHSGKARDRLPLSATAYVAHSRAAPRGGRFPVPFTEYWLVKNDQVIGRMELRHKPHASSSFGRDFASHLFIEVRPSARKRGHGMRLFVLALEKARRLGLKSLLVSCRSSNLPMKNIIKTQCGIMVRRRAVRQIGIIELYRLNLGDKNTYHSASPLSQ
jgi:predicted acetyltransferase